MEIKNAEMSPKEKLRELRYNYSEEKPSTQINSTSPNRDNKFRKTWFMTASGALQMLRDQEEIADPNLVERVDSFIEMCTSKKFKNHPTKAKDIKQANELIDSVLK